MEPKNRHPLECITNQGSLSLLETLIPFVEYPLKLPLALFIKFNEIKLIINAFRSIETLTRFGLNAATGSPTDLLCAMTGLPPDTIKMMMTFSESMNSSSFSPEMLSGLTNQSGMDISNITNILGQLNAQNINSPKSTTETMQNTSHSFDKANHYTTPSANESQSNADQSFDEAIQKILSEYDMSQAEKYGNESEPIQS